MWKDFSRNYLSHNPTAARTMAAAALAAAFFLALLCGLFYNAWAYDVDRILREEGSWHVRLTIPPTDAALEEAPELLEQFAHVDTVTVSEELSGPEKTVVELTFGDKSAIYGETEKIRAALGLAEEQIQVHETLLSRYLITDPRDDTPPLLLPFLLAVWAAAALALILLLHNAFEITMQARGHQLGILASVGATPRQLRRCLLEEAFSVALLPLVLGTVLGFASCVGVLAVVNRVAADLPGRQPAVFRLHPLVVLAALLSALCTVFFSAWLPARRLSRIPPLEALHGDDRRESAWQWKHRRSSPLLSRCFGIRGELAGNALKAQKKSLRIANVSLLLSFMTFTAMLCFFTLSDISTRMTYFERYRDAWDVMAEVQDTGLSDFSLTDALAALPGAEDCVVYEKRQTFVTLSPEMQSNELQALGGFAAVAGEEARSYGDGWLVGAPIVVMDDNSFLRYCEDIGAVSSLDGAVLLNRVWDSLHSHFRARQYLPFVAENTASLPLADKTGAALGDLPLLALTDTAPVLREEYDQYTLVMFWPQSLWEKWSGAGILPAGTEGAELFVRLLGQDGITAAECEALQEDAATLLDREGYTYIIENRPGEQAVNDRMIRGAEMILGAFCLLLAAIGLANVFLNALGFVRQRRREFARYLALGMTPRELRSLFWIEGAVLALRPLVITLPLTGLLVAFMLRASYLDAAVFLAEAPVLPVVLFALLIVGTVALAYALGARKILSADLSEILKDDSLM